MPANALRAELIQCHKQLIFGISGRSRNQQDYFWKWSLKKISFFHPKKFDFVNFSRNPKINQSRKRLTLLLLRPLFSTFPSRTAPISPVDAT